MAGLFIDLLLFALSPLRAGACAGVDMVLLCARVARVCFERFLAMWGLFFLLYLRLSSLLLRSLLLWIWGDLNVWIARDRPRFTRTKASIYLYVELSRYLDGSPTEPPQAIFHHH